MARPDAGRDRDLVEAIRSELAAIEPARACCRAAERLGLGAAATGHARTPAVARLAVRLEETPGAGAPDVPPPVARFDWAAARDHCRAAWLRGLFLSRGSLSLGVGTAHLELVVTPDDVPVLLARLEELELPASARLRRGRGVVTWKSAERILTFLRVIGASSSVLEVESRLVTRQLHGHLNRVLNAETSNLSRSVSASVRQRRAIEQLEAAGLLITLPELERSVAQVRQDQPDASLGELAELLALSRPRVQRALERIELVAAHAPSGRERPPDR